MAAGGKLALFQSGGPTAVVNASLVGAVRIARESGISNVLGALHGAEGVLADDFVELGEFSSSRLNLLKQTPGAALGSSRHRPSDSEVDAIVGKLRAADVRWLVAIGGNDTAETLQRVAAAATESDAPLAVVGIPKTIDNDLPGMDHCPGYGSAARYLAVALRETALDTRAMRRTDPIKIVEVMGRNAGWLAAAGALGRETATDAPHVVFLPEAPRSLAQMVEEIVEAHREHGWVVAIISENQRDENDQPVAGGDAVHVDAHGHSYYESAGAFLARRVQAESGLRTRYERPGALQRTAAWAMSEIDVAEAEMAGADAVRRALDGESGVMVAIQRNEGRYAISLESVDLGTVAHQERRMPESFIAKTGIDVSEDFVAYATPLIGGPLPALFRVGD